MELAILARCGERLGEPAILIRKGELLAGELIIEGYLGRESTDGRPTGLRLSTNS